MKTAKICGSSLEHQKCIEQALKIAKLSCQKKNIRLTNIRTKILEVIWESHKPIKAYEILKKCEKFTGFNNSPPTVYRAINFLLDVGLIHRIESLKSYIGCPEPQHKMPSQFFICESCEFTCEFFSNEHYQKSLRIIEKAGFTITKDLNEIYGICKNCKQV